jgi:hypothetical protein
MPIALIMLGIACTAVFVFIRSPARTLTKFLLVPASLCAAAAVPVMFISLMGYAVPVPPPDKGFVLGHKTIIVGSKKKQLEIWIARDGGSRLYTMPYEKELEDKLNEAAKGRANGMEGQLTFKRKKGGKAQKDSQNNSDGEYEFDLKLLSPEDIMPKHELDELRQNPPQPQAPEPERPAEKPGKWT